MRPEAPDEDSATVLFTDMDAVDDLQALYAAVVDDEPVAETWDDGTLELEQLPEAPQRVLTLRQVLPIALSGLLAGMALAAAGLALVAP